jgi:DNA-binding LytR/AlgR family response regulator
MSATRCLVVDDEPLAIAVIENYIKRLDHLVLAGTARSAEKALEIMNREKIDLLFLDIRMPRLDGIDLLKSLIHPPAVIFTTAHKEYALDGFDLNVTDYLLKPVSFERFLKAVNKFTAVQASGQSIPANTIAAEQYLYLRGDKKRTQKVLLTDILYIESLRNYIKVKTLKQEIISYQNISTLEELLPANDFIRIHRSYIVAIPRIDSLSATDVDVNGITIPIGRMFKNELMKVLGSKGINGQ